MATTNYTYLDQTGLSLLVQKLKTYISEADLATLQSANSNTADKIAIVNAAVEKAQKAADAAQTSADAAQSDVDALVTKVGTVPDEKTVMGIIKEIQDSAYDDTEVRNLINTNKTDIANLKAKDTELAASIKSNADAIDVLNGTGTGSVQSKIDAAINKFATDVTDDGVVNSYKELIDWVVTHGAEAAEMAAGIQSNKNSLDDLKKLVGTIPEGVTATTIVGMIQELVGKEQSRAEGVESGLDTRLKAVETTLGESGSVASDIAKAKEEAIASATATAAADATSKANKALSDAKTYTDEQIAPVQTAVDKNASDIAGLTTRVGTAETNIGNLKTAVDTTLPASIKEAKDAADAAQADVDALEPKVTQNTNNIAAVTTRVESLESVSHTHAAITNEYINGLF